MKEGVENIKLMDVERFVAFLSLSSRDAELFFRLTEFEHR
jgi:hypothetical protein